MFERIIKLLKTEGIENWRLLESVSETAELYFIKKKLDIPRIKKMHQYSVTVFRDFEEGGMKFRGESNALLSPGMTDAEIVSHLKSAYLAASFVRNPWYELADPVKEERKKNVSDLAGKKIEDTVCEFAKAMFEADTAEDAFINSAEIFVTRRYTHIAASNGLDVSFDSDVIDGELVSQCIEPVDVEQYRSFSFDSFDAEAIKEKVAEAVRDVRLRARASEPPVAGTYDIILTGENLEELFELYGARSYAGMVYPGYSQWKVGDKVQGEDIQGEKLNLSFEPLDPYSSEGIPMKERCLIEDGELKLIYGDTRMCRYLGIEPTGEYRKMRCENGTVPLKEMRKPGVLELVSFSDFQMDDFDGHFKGEIRLGLLYKEDGSVEELTGGSVNGSLLELQKVLTFSKERYVDRSYDGPMAVLIPGVAVAGK
ncbi:MAG: hypothetical protein IJM49_00530 [Firmicutes bacterium]|nr:hypothetical protein [Bacillota bacterium]